MKLPCLLLAILATILPAHAEPTASRDFSGVWKRDCDQRWGLRIDRVDKTLFALQLCIYGHCHAHAFGNTPIQGDPRFKVLSETEFGLQNADDPKEFLVYHRCSPDPAWRDGAATASLSVTNLQQAQLR